MNRILLATTFAAMTAGSAAFADAHSPSMGEGFDMLTAALSSDFERLGIPMESLDDLTIGQIAAIKQIIEDDDSGNDKGEIEAIIANN